MKKAICLYGGPGTGKSTTAADLFVKLKQKGVNTELVREYVKDWVWEGRKILPVDQYYLLAKQSRRERICFEDVDVIVTDSPIWLSIIYEKKFEPAPHICSLMIEKHMQQAAKQGVEYHHVFLTREKAYNPKGRFQNEEEAKQIDNEILDYLSYELSLSGVTYSTVVGNNNAAQEIINLLNL